MREREREQTNKQTFSSNRKTREKQFRTRENILYPEEEKVSRIMDSWQD